MNHMGRSFGRNSILKRNITFDRVLLHQIQSPTRKKLPPHSFGNIQTHENGFSVNPHRDICIPLFEMLSDVGINHFGSDFYFAVVFRVTEQQGQYPVITEIGKMDSGKTLRDNRSNSQIARRSAACSRLDPWP